MLIDRGHKVSTNSWLYEYALKEDLEGKSILDYGCNQCASGPNCDSLGCYRHKDTCQLD